MMNSLSRWAAIATLLLAGCGGGGSDQSTVAPGLSLLAGSVEEAASVDASGASARFSNPKGIAIDAGGILYVSDGTTIRRIAPDGFVSTIAGSPGQSGLQDGASTTARFSDPQGLAVDSTGAIYVADYSIRKITPDGVVTTLAGTGPPQECVAAGIHGTPCRALGVAVDATGTVYATYSGYPNSVIQKMTPAGVVSTFAGAIGASGSVDGSGASARFWGPSGVAVDGAGTVYVADTLNNTIRKITTAGVVTTLAGMAAPVGGTTDGVGAAARLLQPIFLAADRSGTVYVADINNHTIRKITPGGLVTTIVGRVGVAGVVLGPLPGGLTFPRALAVGDNGVLYVVSSQAILKVQLPS